MKKISVVIPVYNVEKYLERCLDSIVGQSYANLQIIVVDDGSTDSSKDILKKYNDSRILFLSKKNGGLSSARNFGLEYVEGEYVSFVDSDDWIDLKMFELMVFAAEKNDADIVTVFEKCVCNSGITQKNDLAKNADKVFIGEDCASQLFCNKIPSYSWGKLFKTSLFFTYGICFPVGENYEDVATNYILFSKCKTLVVINKQLYYYYMRSNSIVHTKKINDAVAMLNHLSKMASYPMANNFWGFYRLKLLYGISMYLKSLNSYDRKSVLYKKLEQKVLLLKNEIKTEKGLLSYINQPNFYKVLILRLNLVKYAFYIKKIFIKAKALKRFNFH